MEERIQPIIILAHEKGLITGEMFHCAIEDIERIDRSLQLLDKIAKSINEWGFADFQFIQKTKNLVDKSNLKEGV